MLRVLSELASSREKFSVWDGGAASGDMGQCIREAFPNAKVLLTDYRLAHLRSSALPRLAVDALTCPFTRARSTSWVSSSVRHHFPDNEVVDFDSRNPILARRALIILDLECHPIPYYSFP